jgi:hypothetical protein
LTVKGARKSKSSDGRIDLLALYDTDTFGVIELKNAPLTRDNIDQLKDYIACREEIYEKHKLEVECDFKDSRWIGIIVGTDLSKELEEDISSGKCLIDGDIPVCAITLRRYRGENNQVYVTANTYFKNSSRNLDKTKYSFMGNTLGKSRLVHAIVKEYITQHTGIKYSELSNVFPKSLQGSFGVFTTLENALDIFRRYRYKRHFIKEDETILLGSQEIAICSQWGIGNIKNIIQLAREKLGFDIHEVSR